MAEIYDEWKRDKTDEPQQPSVEEMDYIFAAAWRIRADRLLSKSGIATHTNGTEIRTVGLSFLGKGLWSTMARNQTSEKL